MKNLPYSIRKILQNEKYTVNNIGMSGSSVLMFENKVLKIQSVGDEAENEYAMMLWLKNKLPTPQVLVYECADGKSYLLMSKLQGEMACSQRFLNNPTRLIELLAEALQMLWAVDISDCPSKINLDKKLQMAQFAVRNNLVDVNNVEPETFGKNGFENPQALLNWLVRNRPEEEPTLSHGDFCLPNIFLQDGKVTGFIDLGKTCVSDKYQDIALCYRSLRDNFGGKYGGEPVTEARAELLFEKLQITPNWDKIRYYLLLDELF